MPRRAMDGGSAMSRDGLYAEKSQGWQLGHVQGWRMPIEVIVAESLYSHFLLASLLIHFYRLYDPHPQQ